MLHANLFQLFHPYRYGLLCVVRGDEIKLFCANSSSADRHCTVDKGARTNHLRFTELLVRRAVKADTDHNDGIAEHNHLVHLNL